MPHGSSSPARVDDGMEMQSLGLGEPRHMVAIATVLAAMVLVVLDAAIANVALPTIARSLSVTPAMSVWVITAYQTALLMALLPCAALGESVGYRRVFTVGVALFTGASVLCALSPTLSWLVAARLLQGLGGSAVMALGVALLRVVVPDRRLGTAIGWSAVAIALSSAAGHRIKRHVHTDRKLTWSTFSMLSVTRERIWVDSDGGSPADCTCARQ